MTFEEQIKTYRELGDKINELELQRKALGFEIIQQMEEKTVKMGGFVVRHYKRLSIKLSIEEARIFDATKMEEVVDKDRIKALYEQGEPVQGVSEIEYIHVSREKKKMIIGQTYSR
ncbi:MAG: hypothetical protein A3E80_02660 [Chlamydiae bacterium RIFCSPHIGHO2_12_FULL_49_9]|nr:MAG: hypothetical protein A3E80_02660 [Chlamydiae bacterium RIFCSPHIGHO2_12_FULL_49_9]